jgi:hypothetical protein
VFLSFMFTFQSVFYKPFSGSDIYIVKDILNYTEVTEKSPMDGRDEFLSSFCHNSAALFGNYKTAQDNCR